MKILALTGSYGAGHNSATNAIKNFILENFSNYKFETLDLVSFFGKLGKLSQSFYELTSNDFPKIWEKTFNIFDNKIITRIVNGIENPLIQDKFNQIINEYKPNIIVVIFPFWNGFLKQYIKSFGKTFKTFVIITDSINIHSIWYLKKNYIDYYFVIDDFTKNEFIKKFEHTKDNIITSFFPIEKKFFVNKEKINNKNIIFLLTGIEEEFILNFLEILSNQNEFNLKIVKGRNQENFEKAKKKFEQINNFEFIDFIDLKQELKNTDIFIGKPGGAITCECIATDTFFIVPNFIPGQEEGNIKLLKFSETGIYEQDPQKILFLLKYLDFNKFLNNFKTIKKENSIEIIINTLLKE